MQVINMLDVVALLWFEVFNVDVLQWHLDNPEN